MKMKVKVMSSDGTSEIAYRIDEYQDRRSERIKQFRETDEFFGDIINFFDDKEEKLTETEP